ncbi:MAG: hypothetical protein OXG19_01530 [Chloroflexi bacterium]|nr:hypothetical protein [Chloroflexota bacterium]
MPARADEPGARPRRATRFAGLSREAAEAVAALLGAPLRVEPYCEAAAEPVYRIDYRSPRGNITLVLWPAYARVDARCGPHTWVAKGVASTEVLDGIEVIFRMHAGGLLFVTVEGAIFMVGGGTAKGSGPAPGSQA